MRMTGELSFPSIFLIPTHLTSDEFLHLHTRIPSLTSNISDASVIVCKLFRRERILFELRRLGFDSINSAQPLALEELRTSIANEGPSSKRQKTTHLKTADALSQELFEVVAVVKVAWLTESLASGKVLPIDSFLLCNARRPLQAKTTVDGSTKETRSQSSPNIHNRSRSTENLEPPVLRPSGGSTPDSAAESNPQRVSEALALKYSCQRSTPMNTANNDFIKLMKDIRKLRLLRGDKVGTRAYSTSIASIAAYPYLVTSSHGEPLPQRFNPKQTFRG